MKRFTLLAALTTLLLAAPALAGPVLPVEAEECSPYLQFINPHPPVYCAGVYFGNVNDFCVYAPKVTKCVQFVGPVLA